MVSITVDIRPVLALTDRVRRQIPFAASKAINDTLTDIQAAQREHIQDTFTLRRPQFILRTVKIDRRDRATKHHLVGVIRIDPQRPILAKFEKGGTKRPIEGRHIAIPHEIRRTKTGNISKANRPRALLARKRKVFIVKDRTAELILETVGRGKNAVNRVLYWLRPSVRLPASLRFEAIARRTTERKFRRNWERAFAFAMRTAR